MLFALGCEKSDTPKKVSIEKRSPQPTSNSTPVDIDSLKFGFDLRLGPKDDVKIYLPFLRYLEQYTGRRFSLRFTERYEDTVENLGKGITHLAALGPVNAILAIERHGASCLAVGLNNEGKPEYRAVIFTKTNSQVKRLADLRGKRFAFGDKFSTQGHIIPRKMIEDNGLTLKDLKSFTYTGSHANTAKAVLNGEYDAGGMQDALAKRLSEEGKIRVIAVSRPFPSSLICSNKDIDPVIVKNVKQALLSFSPRGKHSNTLVDWHKTEMPNGFTDFSEVSLDEIRLLVKRYGILE